MQIKSAGKKSPSLTLTKSPTRISFQSQTVHVPLTYRALLLELSSKSLLCLDKSSKPSLRIERLITKTNGAIEEIGLIGDMAGKHWMTAITKK